MDSHAQRVERLLEAAIARPAGEREAFVRERCSDPEVLRSVLTLLPSRSSGATPLPAVSQELQRLLNEADREGRAEPDLVGQVLRDPDSGKPRWEVMQRLPSSSRAEVYVVIDRSTETPLVAKTYPVHANRAELRDAFVVEAAIWVALPPHPFVANAFGVQSINGRPFIFVEYFAQGDLSARLRSGRIDEPLALWYGVQICDAMRHAYAYGLRAHRDLKPANCLLRDNTLVAVTDFGIGLTIVADGGVQLVGGTPEYMPPEQWASAECDVRSDIYAFAATLYEMLAGRPPLGRRGDVTVRELQRRHEQVPVARVAGLADPINALLTECMAKAPDDRPNSFDSVRDTLAHVLREGYGTEVPQTAVETPPDVSQHVMRQANSLDALGRSQEALALYGEVLRRDPDNAVALANRCDTLRKLRRNDEACRDGERAIKLTPDSAVAWLNLGNAYDDAGRADEAKRCYGNAEALEPGIAGRLAYERAVVLDREERSVEAEAAYCRALELNPDNAMALSNLGQLLRERGERGEALSHFDEALRLNPDLEEAHFNKGCMLYEDGKFAEALGCFQQAVRVAPNDELNHRWIDKTRARLAEIE